MNEQTKASRKSLGGVPNGILEQKEGNKVKANEVQIKQRLWLIIYPFYSNKYNLN
jgi:hypothetical protein